MTTGARPRADRLTRALALSVAALVAGSGVGIAVHADPHPLAVRMTSPAAAPAIDDAPVTTAPISAVPAPPASTGGVVPARRPARVTIPTVPVTVPPLPVTVPPLPSVDACTPVRPAAAPPGALQDIGTYTAAPDGTGIVRVAPSVDPGAWNRDRSLVAFRYGTEDSAAMCVADARTGVAHQVGYGNVPGGFWGPGATQEWAGKRVVFEDPTGTTPGAALVDPATSEKRYVAPACPFDVSPDGTTLAYIWCEASRGPAELRTVDLATGTTRTVTGIQHQSWPYLPRWLPDGRHVAFLASGLYVVDIASGATTTVVSDSTSVDDFAISADGHRVAYSTYGGDTPGTLYVSNMDGTGTTELATGPITFVAWSPDGGALVYATSNRATATLDTIRVDGSGHRTLVQAQTRSGEHWLRFILTDGWSPDGTRLEFSLWHDRAASSVGS